MIQSPSFPSIPFTPFFHLLTHTSLHFAHAGGEAARMREWGMSSPKEWEKWSGGEGVADELRSSGQAEVPLINKRYLIYV